MKKASGSKKEIKKEATSSRPRRNRQAKETTKQVIDLTESGETDSDYAEFLRTYDPEKPYSEYLAEVHQAMLDYLSDANTVGDSKPEESKKDESEAKSDVESK
ncbi:hypothetical protein P8452_09826 [Trifolium repens]|nr:hypothetical protein QL285_053382 [Trifolium repens]WJX20250.1 hypothetical protein P8452_09826 [Trifolium repens]